MTGMFLMPMDLLAYSSSPPLGLTGAPGEGTCGNCHSPVTTGSGIGITFPGALTYTPGGAAINLTVALDGALNGGFELSSRALNNNSQAGTLAAGAYSSVSTSGSIQYAYHTGVTSSWPLTWTPPATNVGNIVMYVAGVTRGQTYTNSFTLTPAGGTPAQTLSASPSALTFNYSGTAPPSQTVNATSSGAAIALTAAVSTASGGNWLTASPAAGSTPLAVTVNANPAGLAVGTYTGSVTLASSGATNSPQTIGVVFNVTTAPPPAIPTITSTPSSLSFAAATAGATVAAQALVVTSSDASALAFTAAASTTSGGNWLAVTPASGTAPASFSVSVTTTGLANGSYTGAVTITSAGASNSPFAIPVTLTIGAAPPPQIVPLQFSFNVVDKQTGGSDEMLLDGSGSTDSSGKVTGSGQFTRFQVNSGSRNSGHTVLSTGTWTATSVVSFTPVSATSTSGGVLVLNADLKTAGSSTVTPVTLRIANTGTDSGVTLTITGGATFTPTGTGHVSISAGTSGCPVPAAGGGSDSGDGSGTGGGGGNGGNDN